MTDSKNNEIDRETVSNENTDQPGSGRVDAPASAKEEITFAKRLRTETAQALADIDYDGWVTVEAFSRFDPEFAAMIHIWRDFDPLEQIWRDGLRFLRETFA